MLSIDLFDYNLPSELIAQEPLKERDQARMLVLGIKDNRLIHSYFYELPKFLKPKDVVVINKTKVLKARLFGEAQDTGGKLALSNYLCGKGLFCGSTHSRSSFYRKGFQGT